MVVFNTDQTLSVVDKASVRLSGVCSASNIPTSFLTIPGMDSFVCHLDWATGCPDTWPNIILAVSVRASLDEINTWIGRLGKAHGFPSLVWWAASNQSKT